MGDAARKVFQSGGTIGRLRENDWVLPDQHISGHHARISSINGSYFIEDTSINGVFHGTPQNRIPRGQRQELRHGDVVFIDDYEVRVRIVAAPNELPAPAPARARARGSVGRSPAPVPAALFDDPAGLEAAATDPLRLLGLRETPVERPTPSAAGLAASSPLSQHYRPPSAPDGPPDDYDPFATDEPAPVNRAPRPATSQGRLRPPPGPLPPGQRRPAATVAAAGSPQITAPWTGPPPDVRAARVAFPDAAGSAQRGPITDRRAPRSGSRAADLDFTQLLAGAGLESSKITPEFAQQFGKILRVVVSGLMDVLQARVKIKDEFRLRETKFKPTEKNNPLKFSANVEDALHNILVKRNSAYLGPVEAFDDAFSDVRNHQLAMLAGMRAAYEAMLADFNPDKLQREFEEDMKGKSFFGPAKHKYWELYVARFRAMVKDADSSYRQLFGDEFAKAYDDQLSRLKTKDRR